MSEMDKDILKEIEKHQEQNFKKKSLDNKTKKNQQKKELVALLFITYFVSISNNH